MPPNACSTAETATSPGTLSTRILRLTSQTSLEYALAGVSVD